MSSEYLTRDESAVQVRRLGDAVAEAFLLAGDLAAAGFGGHGPVLDLTDDERAALGEAETALQDLRRLLGDRLPTLMYSAKVRAEAVTTQARWARQAQGA